MSVNRKEKRNEILQKLLRILWAENVDKALAYMQNLSKSVLRPNNRIAQLLRYIEKHREHIPPYALRAKLGLRIPAIASKKQTTSSSLKGRSIMV